MFTYMPQAFLLLIIFIFTLGFHDLAYSQDTQSMDQIYLNDQDLHQFLGSDWSGILILCKPYCSPVSRREKGIWTPALTGDLVQRKWLKPVAESDPLFPLLIESQKNPSETDADAEKNKEKAAKKKEKKELKPPVPPKYSKMSFNYAWNLDAGFQLSKRTVSSNNAIQSDIEPSGLVRQMSLRLGLMKGQPTYFWGTWYQHRAELLYNMAGESTSADGESLSYSSMAVQYQIWATMKRFKTGPRLTWMSDTMTSGSDSLTHSSTNYTGYLLGWSVLWRRLNFFVDTMVMGSIKDEASFRSSPFDQTYYKAGVERCSKDLSLFDIHFGWCGSLAYVMDRQTSSLASNLLLGDKSELDTSSIFLRLAIRFGGDFYQ